MRACKRRPRAPVYDMAHACTAGLCSRNEFLSVCFALRTLRVFALSELLRTVFMLRERSGQPQLNESPRWRHAALRQRAGTALHELAKRTDCDALKLCDGGCCRALSRWHPRASRVIGCDKAMEACILMLRERRGQQLLNELPHPDMLPSDNELKPYPASFPSGSIVEL